MNNSIENRILVYEKDGSSLKPIKIYYDNQGKKWIESRNNTKFVIEIKNNDYETYLSVISVDGLNVINANRAELKPKDGYVLYGKTSMKITGWRTSLNNTREFIFTNDKNDSYSHKLGADETNTGVIGLAFFKEKKYLNSTSIWPPLFNSSSGNYFTSTSSALTSSTTSASYTTNCSYSSDSSVNVRSLSMSTKQGDSVEDKACEVDKSFEDKVFATDVIYYDSRENLIAKGIIKESTDELPEPFLTTGFCPII